MITDPIASLLTQIRNAYNARHLSTKTPASRLKESVLKVLMEEGFVASYELEKAADGKNWLRIRLRYAPTGAPAIKEISRMSKPGRRVYAGSDDVPVYRRGLGIIVLSTSQGVMTDREARKRGIGGELVCSVF